MDRLIEVSTPEQIPAELRGTPYGLLLEYQNMNRPFDTYTQAQLLVGMCMDNRKQLHIPENFAFILRLGGANLRYSEFKISYAIGVGGVNHVALIGHNNCGMVNLAARKELFIQGIMERAGWDRSRAESHFLSYSPLFEIGNEIDFLLSETVRLRQVYGGIKFLPMLYRIEDNRLFLIRE